MFRICLLPASVTDTFKIYDIDLDYKIKNYTYFERTEDGQGFQIQYLTVDT